MYTSNTNTEAFSNSCHIKCTSTQSRDLLEWNLLSMSPKNNTHLLTGWFRPMRASPPVAASVSAAPRGCPRPSTLQEADWLGTRNRRTSRRCTVLFLEWWLLVARRICLPPRPASGSRGAERLIVQAGRPGEEVTSKKTMAAFSSEEARSRLEQASAEIICNI